MAIVRTLSRSFAGGEITPELADRVDLGQYQTGLAQCINAIIYPHGPAQKRGGTRLINHAKYSWEGGGWHYDRNVNLVPFQFSAAQSYMLEFGHRYVRFHAGNYYDENGSVVEGGTLLDGVNIEGEMIRSEGVDSGPVNRIAIMKENHGLAAGKKILVTVTQPTRMGDEVGTINASSGSLPQQQGVLKNDYWVVIVAGNAILSRQANVGYLLRAKQSDPYNIATSGSGSIAGTTFTDTTHGLGIYAVGHYLYGAGVTPGTYIAALLTGTGANDGGTYTVNISQTVSATTITGQKADATKWEYVPVEDWDQFDGDTEYTVEDPDKDMFYINIDSSLTGAAPPARKTFSKITRAKRALVKSVAHGYSDGDTVLFKLTNKNPAKVHFNAGIPYKVSDATTDTYKIKSQVIIDEDGTTSWEYLNTKKAFANLRFPRGWSSLIEFEPDIDIATVSYTVRREIFCDNDDIFTQESHGFYTGQIVWLVPVAEATDQNDFYVGRFIRSDYYEVEVIDLDTFYLYLIDGERVSYSGEAGPLALGSVYPIYEVETEYDHLDVHSLDFTQSYDVLTVAHKKYAPVTLVRNGASEWEMRTEAFIPTNDIPSGAKAIVSGNTGSDLRAVYYAITAVNNQEESYPAYVEKPPTSVSKISSAIVYSPSPIFIGDGYYNDPVSLNTSVGQGFKLSSGALSIGSLIRLDAGDDMSDEFARAFEGEGMNDAVYRVVAKLKSGWYVVARRSKNRVDWGLFEGSLQAGDLDCYRSGSVSVDFSVNKCRVALSWLAAPDTAYNVYKRVGGSGGDPLGYIGRTENGYFTDDNITPDLSLTPPIGDGPFEGVGNYPACVDYFEQRKAFAGTENRPQTIWMTQIASESNMLQSLPTKATDSINFRMAGREQNAVKFMAALQDLILFTENSEWRVGATEGSVLTPSSVSVKQQSANGCADVKPVVANNAILFVQSGSNRVLKLNYNWNAQSYAADDVSMLAYHLFENKSIIAMTMERGTFPILWCVRNDGILLALTFIPEQNVIAWHQHEVGGEVISARAIKEETGPAVYLAVRREINGGSWRLLIERMDNYTNWLNRKYLDSYCEVIIPPPMGTD